MTLNYQIDSTDLAIIQELQKDARKPFLEIARKLNVSGGTIHQRYLKMQELGVIKGSHLEVDLKKLGFNMEIILGIHLKSAKDNEKVIQKLKRLNEITEIYFTTGNYALLIKITVKDIDHFHEFLVKKLQAIPEVDSTESFISLARPLKRELDIEAFL
ncbi:MAG: AsnC family transcriptional regulator [Bdellovibrionaceae bacterium]|jgi:Lrp/AsnC family transcriptional regulator, regulator for asnA, asnC and gidA|nr:AsnC family transcriptional regulator [Pseudobdellovibrionaceae bacterium]